MSKETRIQKEVDVDAMTCSFFVPGFASIIVEADALSEAVQKRGLLHGLSQKIGDAGALPAGATLAEKYAALRAMADRLIAGEWLKARGEGETSTGLLREALARMFPGRDIEAFLAGKSKEQKAALRNTAKLAAIIAQIRAERAAAKDTGEGDDLLAELEEGE